MNQPFIKNINKHIDFVVPIKKIGMFTKAVLEGIYTFYAPKRIFVVVNCSEKEVFEQEVLETWNKNASQIIFVNEETFFVKHFGLTMNDLMDVFDRVEKRDQEKHREFGWWYQQLIKLGACTQIEDITEEYVVWDGDLIPLKKWELYPDVAAILQEQPRSEFNRQEYNKCIYHLLGINVSNPVKGTFVTHHMVFQKKYLKEMFHHIQIHNKLLTSWSWPLYIISLSHTFYRFSEYLLYATFVTHSYSDAFHYHPFEKYGKSGIRFRETNEIIQKMKKTCDLCNRSFTYAEVANYFLKKEECEYGCKDGCKDGSPSYVQFEHVYFI